MLRKIPLLALTLLLSACFLSEQQQCISRASSDYNAMARRATVVQGNINRGYAIHTQTVPYTRMETCYTDEDIPQPYVCAVEDTRIEETPVAIDIDAERRKLADLRRRMDAMRPGLDAAIAQCRATYPE